MGELQILSRSALFSGLDDTVLEQLITAGRSIFVRRDDFFFREFDEAAGVFVLIEGRAAELKTYQHERHLLRYIEPADSFGELIIVERAPRETSVVAVADCVAIEIPSTRFRKINQNDVRQFLTIQTNFCRAMKKRLAETQKQMFADPEETMILKGEQVLRPSGLIAAALLAQHKHATMLRD